MLAAVIAMILVAPAEDAIAARLRAAGLMVTPLPGPVDPVFEVRGAGGLFYVALSCEPPVTCVTFYTQYRLARPMSAETLARWSPGSPILKTEIDKAGNPAIHADWRWGAAPSEAQIDAAIQSWLRASGDFWSFALAHQSQ